jgi:hypothetical protein
MRPRRLPCPRRLRGGRHRSAGSICPVSLSKQRHAPTPLGTPALMSLDARQHLEETRRQVDTDPSNPNASSAFTSKNSTDKSSTGDSYGTAVVESPEGTGEPAARQRLEEAWARYVQAHAARLRSPVQSEACTFSCTLSRSRATWSKSASRIAGTAAIRSGCRSSCLGSGRRSPSRGRAKARSRRSPIGCGDPSGRGSGREGSGQVQQRSTPHISGACRVGIRLNPSRERPW